MKTLSLYQPHAQLVVLGLKKWETRSFKTKYRGPLLIHASKKFTREEKGLCWEEPFRLVLPGIVDYGAWADVGAYDRERFEKLPLGAIIGRVDLVDCITTEEWMLQNTVAGDKHVSGGVELLLKPESANEYAFGNFSYGRYAWKLENFYKFAEPIPAKGSLGLWQFPESALGHLAERASA